MVFTNLLLATVDQPHPTQDAGRALEAMEERQVRVWRWLTAQPVHRRRDAEPSRIRRAYPVAQPWIVSC